MMNQEMIVSKIIELDIDIIMLQEVAQYFDDKLVKDKIRDSNYGLQLQRKLREKEKTYNYCYEPIKQSFKKYDEGLGILSKYPINDFAGIYISKTRDYSNWKSRKMVKCQTIIDQINLSLVNVHMGWSDGYEVFEDQVDLLVENSDLTGFTIFAGDFNVRPSSKEYAYLISKGLIDVFKDDQKMFNKFTFSSETDAYDEKSRIDYFFFSKEFHLLDRELLFTEKLVSDHYGVYIKIQV
jgi:maltose 6'-phosphate phosphatase